MLGAIGKSMSKKKLSTAPAYVHRDDRETESDKAILSILSKDGSVLRSIPLRASTARPGEAVCHHLDDKEGMDARLNGFKGVDLSSAKATRVRLQPLGYPREGTNPAVCHTLANQQGMAARLGGFQGAELGDSEKVCLLLWPSGSDTRATLSNTMKLDRPHVLHVTIRNSHRPNPNPSL